MKNNNSKRESTVKQFAKNYIQKGWKPIPVEPGEKACKKSGWKHLRITEETIDQHFGDNSNIGVLLGGVSGDLVDIDLDCPEAIAAGSVLLPRTNAVFGRESARRSHYLYTSIEPMKYQKFNCPGHGTLVEIRTCGDEATHFTVFPPSYRADIDETVSWEGSDDTEPAVVSAEALERKVRHCAVASLLARHWPRGCRHQAALAVAGYLLKSGIPLADAENIMQAICAAAFDEEVDDRLKCVRDTQVKMNQVEELVARGKLKEMFGKEVVNTLDDWLEIASPVSKKSSTGKSRSESPDTELSCAERFVDRYEHEIRFDSETQNWLFFNGSQWEQDTTQAVKARACQFTKDLLKEALQETNPMLRHNLEKSARALQSNHRINGFLSLANTIQRISVRGYQLDTHADLLNCKNGTLDLQTGTLTKHDPEHLLTRITSTPYDPSARAPRFQQFLNRIFQADPELIQFVQKVLSFGLIGGNPEQHMYILHGQGANGKSVLMKVITDVLGEDYAKQLTHHTLLINHSSNGARPDLARLKGARLAVAPEMNSQMQLDEALIKSLTACDKLSARGLYEGNSEFRPELTIFLHTNHMPVIKDNGLGIWRRMVVIPFDVSIPREEQDPNLDSELMKEAEGILTWLVEGYREYQENGLVLPKAVKIKLGSYRKSMDPIGYFLEERVRSLKGATTGASDLYNAYQDWCEASEAPVVNIKDFKASLMNRGYESKSERTGNNWIGVKLLDDSDDIEEVGDEQDV